MIERIVWNVVTAFILRQIEKFKKSINWDLVKSDVALRVRKLVPGTWFDDDAADAVTYIIDTLQRALSSDQIDDLIKLVAAKQYDDAIKVLRGVLVCAWSQQCAVPKAQSIVLA